jgi:REP element-mobilizing transposase RayT
LTVYHVTLRCNNKDLMMKTPKDLQSLLCVVAHYKLKYKFKFYGYVVMNSHGHLVIETPPDEKATISKIMHDIALKYAKDYNFRHGRTGHFWGGRFKSPVVETDSHGLNLLRYISQNPVRAGMTKTPGEYGFDSFGVYKNGEPDGLVDLLPTFEGLASTRKRAAELFVEYCGAVQEKQNDSWTCSYVIGTGRFIKKVLRDNGLAPPRGNGLAAADPPT